MSRQIVAPHVFRQKSIPSGGCKSRNVQNVRTYVLTRTPVLFYYLLRKVKSLVMVMSSAVASTNPKQMEMRGMPEVRRALPTVRCCNLAPGQQVLYLGRIQGGPRYGSPGVVMRVLSHKAVVEIQGAGIWNIPYFFLSKTKAA